MGFGQQVLNKIYAIKIFAINLLLINYAYHIDGNYKEMET